ncbi:hypothetical protein F7R02_09055 [Xanthomonas cissicola]|nr:hypothetical protein F7R02_09055 [Xanthomonas cissicola]
MDGIECFYGMRSRRYHVTTLRIFMVSKSRNAMILLFFTQGLAGFWIMVFELNQAENHVDRYQAAQPQAEGQALQGE